MKSNAVGRWRFRIFERVDRPFMESFGLAREVISAHVRRRALKLGFVTERRIGRSLSGTVVRTRSQWYSSQFEIAPARSGDC